MGESIFKYGSFQIKNNALFNGENDIQNNSPSNRIFIDLAHNINESSQ